MGGRQGGRRVDARHVPLAKAPKDHTHLGLCLLYSGAAFRGLQLQAHGPTSHTLEGTLLQAMKDAGVIVDVVRGRPAGDQHHFARSCRTDRGVHAIRNMVSLFVPNDVLERLGGLEGLRARVNDHLPAMMRVAHVMQLAGNFVPRHCCNRRVYRYLLPLYALLPPCDTWAALEKHYPGCLAQLHALATASEAAQRSLYGVPYADVAALNTLMPSPAPTIDADGAAAPPSWVRDTQAKVDFCNELLASRIVGSRRYHNFSVDIDSNRSGVNAKVVQPDTDEALRVVYRCEVHPRLLFFPCAADGEKGPLALHGASLSDYTANTRVAPQGEQTAASSAPPSSQLPAGTRSLPFLFFQIEGGSFLLNMIRKIVGSLLAVCRGARTSIVDEALNPERRVTTPLAPGPYLYLAQSTYHRYDRSLSRLPGARLTTVKDAWAGAVDEAAEHFAFHVVAADVVDVDLNAMPPLDDQLAARDTAQAVRRPHTASEDGHLVEMKEYKPVVPSRTAWPASSEMTIFLRLLRVHNWNVRPIKLDPNCKALREVRNRDERAAAAAAADGDATAAVCAAPAAVEATSLLPEDGAESVTPYGGTDGWLYLAASPAEAQVMGQEYFASRWRRARPWEFDAAAGAEKGGEDDGDDDGGPPRRRQRA